MTTSAEPADAVTSVAWSSQGVESKLAAVAGSVLAVFTLEHYISAIVQQTPIAQPHPGQTPACQAQHTCPLAALSWTQEGDGLLSADTQGCIIMWRITSTTDEPQQLTQAWLGGSSTVIQSQTIIAAGASILSPSASACPGTKHVTIWWPEELQRADAEPAAFIPAGKDAGAPVVIAVAEQLRHPVGVVAAQWSPGSLQHGKCAHAHCPHVFRQSINDIYSPGRGARCDSSNILACPRRPAHFTYPLSPAVSSLHLSLSLAVLPYCTT